MWNDAEDDMNEDSWLDASYEDKFEDERDLNDYFDEPLDDYGSSDLEDQDYDDWADVDAGMAYSGDQD